MKKSLFIEKVEQNRGEIKNKSKYYGLLDDIDSLGCKELKEELTDRKSFGIGFIHKIAIEFVSLNQRELLKRIYSGESKPSIAFARTQYELYKKELKNV